MIIRGFQFLLSLVILGLCARLMHDATLPEEAFSVAVVSLSLLSPHLMSTLTRSPGNHHMDCHNLRSHHRKDPQPSKRIPYHRCSLSRWPYGYPLARSLGGHRCSTRQICRPC
jgi:hypothetical protein